MSEISRGNAISVNIAIANNISRFIIDCEKMNCSPSDTSNSCIRSMHGFYRIWESASIGEIGVDYIHWDKLSELIAIKYCDNNCCMNVSDDALRLIETAGNIWNAWNHQASMMGR